MSQTPDVKSTPRGTNVRILRVPVFGHKLPVSFAVGTGIADDFL